MSQSQSTTDTMSTDTTPNIPSRRLAIPVDTTHNTDTTANLNDLTLRSLSSSPTPSYNSSDYSSNKPRGIYIDTNSTAVPIQYKARRPCNCKNSKCLKLYCECFAAGLYCDSQCKCQTCCNDILHESIRQQAMETTKERNPRAFMSKIAASPMHQQSPSNNSIHMSPSISQRNVHTPTTQQQPSIATIQQSHIEPLRQVHNRGCHCKKSFCLKKYCECFQNGILCSELCRCVECKNYAGSTDRMTMEATGQIAAPPTPVILNNANNIKLESHDIISPRNTMKQQSNGTQQSYSAGLSALTHATHVTTQSVVPSSYGDIISDDVVTKFARTLVHVAQAEESNVNEQAVQDLLLLSFPPIKDTKSTVTSTLKRSADTESSNITNTPKKPVHTIQHTDTDIEALARETVQRSFAVKHQISDSSMDNTLQTDESDTALKCNEIDDMNELKAITTPVKQENTNTTTALQQAQEHAILKELNHFLGKVVSVAQRRSVSVQPDQ